MSDLITALVWFITPDGGPPPFAFAAVVYACLSIRRFLSAVES